MTDSRTHRPARRRSGPVLAAALAAALLLTGAPALVGLGPAVAAGGGGGGARPASYLRVNDPAGDVTGTAAQQAVDVTKVVYAFVPDYPVYGPAFRIHVGFRGHRGGQAGRHHTATRFWAGGTQYVARMSGSGSTRLLRFVDGERRQVPNAVLEWSYGVAGSMEVFLAVDALDGARRVNGFRTRMWWGDEEAVDRTRKSGPLTLRRR